MSNIISYVQKMFVLQIIFMVWLLSVNNAGGEPSNTKGLKESKRSFNGTKIYKHITTTEEFPHHISATASNLSSDQKLRALFNRRNITMSNPYQSPTTRKLLCDPFYKYRSIDGSCNNLKNPTWGMVDTTYSRILPADYRAANGYNLTSARKLSTVFFPDVQKDDVGASLTVMQWGQFVTHDIALTTNSTVSQTNCCDENLANNKSICLPISIPADDPFYSKFNVTCQSMIRDALVPEKFNQFGEQMNSVTHILDGSQVYGSQPDVSKSLREFEGGRLLVQKCTSGNQYLPSSERSNCNITGDTVQYRAGDVRVNQTPQLAIMHTLFVREHNRIVRQLEQLHKSWSDEKLFQEGRAIVIAELQHITYNEYLPMMLGKDFMTIYGLYTKKFRDFTYNSELTPVTINSFTASAFRVGHSAIQGQISLFNNYKGCPWKTLKFSDTLFKAGMIQQEENFDQLLRGLTKQPMHKLDNFYSQEITEQLFPENSLYGLDLVSTDIQRGRDHGIPSYVEFLNLCTGKKPQTFSDLTEFIPSEFIPPLEQYYKSVNDIDLFVGGHLEIVQSGSRLGPTFQCIIGEQFYRYKYGDRFWYEIRGQPHSFTNGQLHEIKKITLSKIICDNSDDITNVVLKSFVVPSTRNPVLPCQLLRSINLNLWK